MAFGRDTNAEHIKPLTEQGTIVRRGTLGATVAAGELVTLQSDGFWDPTLTTAVQLTIAVAVQGGVAGDRVDLVRHGGVVCCLEGTPGALVYGSDTAGEPSATAGTKSTVVGYMESATVLFVQPQIVNFT